jgi:hypothetical protein
MAEEAQGTRRVDSGLDHMRMNAWIRPMPIDPLKPEMWHLQMAISHSGLRIAECGYSLPPSELVDVRPLGEVPSLDVCDECATAYQPITGAALAKSN